MQRVLTLQSERLLQALGDLYPADAKVALLERLARLYPKSNAKVLLGQSGSDAVSAALKTAKLATGKPGVVAFSGAYHGLGYGPLAACGLRESYRAPFADELNQHVRFVPYPGDAAKAERSGEAVLTARFDLDRIANARASWGLFRDRRPDLYLPLLSLDGHDQTP